MVRAEPLNTRTARVGTNTSTTFTLLLVIRTQRNMWSLEKGGCSSNSKIVPAEITRKYTLPFNKSVKLHYNCCNLSGGVALIVWFTTNGMCGKNNTTICVARASISKSDCEHDFYCCLLPRCEALRTCRSRFPIATQPEMSGLSYFAIQIQSGIFKTQSKSNHSPNLYFHWMSKSK